MSWPAEHFNTRRHTLKHWCSAGNRAKTCGRPLLALCCLMLSGITWLHWRGTQAGWMPSCADYEDSCESDSMTRGLRPCWAGSRPAPEARSHDTIVSCCCCIASRNNQSDWSSCAAWDQTARTTSTCAALSSLWPSILSGTGGCRNSTRPGSYRPYRKPDLARTSTRYTCCYNSLTPKPSATSWRASKCLMTGQRRTSSQATLIPSRDWNPGDWKGTVLLPAIAIFPGGRMPTRQTIVGLLALQVMPTKAMPEDAVKEGEPKRARLDEQAPQELGTASCSTTAVIDPRRRQNIMLSAAGLVEMAYYSPAQSSRIYEQLTTTLEFGSEVGIWFTRSELFDLLQTELATRQVNLMDFIRIWNEYLDFLRLTSPTIETMVPWRDEVTNPVEAALPCSAFSADQASNGATQPASQAASLEGTPALEAAPAAPCGDLISLHMPVSNRLSRKARTRPTRVAPSCFRSNLDKPVHLPRRGERAVSHAHRRPARTVATPPTPHNFPTRFNIITTLYTVHPRSIPQGRYCRLSISLPGAPRGILGAPRCRATAILPYPDNPSYLVNLQTPPCKAVTAWVVSPELSRDRHQLSFQVAPRGILGAPWCRTLIPKVDPYHLPHPRHPRFTRTQGAATDRVGFPTSSHDRPCLWRPLMSSARAIAKYGCAWDSSNSFTQPHHIEPLFRTPGAHHMRDTCSEAPDLLLRRWPSLAAISAQQTVPRCPRSKINGRIRQRRLSDLPDNAYARTLRSVKSQARPKTQHANQTQLRSTDVALTENQKCRPLAQQASFKNARLGARAGRERENQLLVGWSYRLTSVQAPDVLPQHSPSKTGPFHNTHCGVLFSPLDSLVRTIACTSAGNEHVDSALTHAYMRLPRTALDKAPKPTLARTMQSRPGPKSGTATQGSPVGRDARVDPLAAGGSGARQHQWPLSCLLANICSHALTHGTMRVIHTPLSFSFSPSPFSLTQSTPAFLCLKLLSKSSRSSFPCPKPVSLGIRRCKWMLLTATCPWALQYSDLVPHATCTAGLQVHALRSPGYTS